MTASLSEQIIHQHIIFEAWEGSGIMLLVYLPGFCCFRYISSAPELCQSPACGTQKCPHPCPDIQQRGPGAPRGVVHTVPSALGGGEEAFGSVQNRGLPTQLLLGACAEPCLCWVFQKKKGHKGEKTQCGDNGGICTCQGLAACWDTPSQGFGAKLKVDRQWLKFYSMSASPFAAYPAQNPTELPRNPRFTIFITNLGRIECSKAPGGALGHSQ